MPCHCIPDLLPFAGKSYEAGVKLLRALMVAEPQMPDQATASVEFKEHDAMVLHPTGDAKMPQLGKNAPIFIRYFYMDCITGVMSDLDPSNTAKCRRFIVLGNPGSECCLSACALSRTDMLH